MFDLVCEGGWLVVTEDGFSVTLDVSAMEKRLETERRQRREAEDSPRERVTLRHASVTTPSPQLRG